jgi:cobalt/nickel transport system permease protein
MLLVFIEDVQNDTNVIGVEVNVKLQLDTLAYTNQLRHLPPEHKLVFALALLMLALVAQPFVQLLITLWLSVWIVGYGKIPLSVYLRLLGIVIVFWLASAPALLLNIAPMHGSQIGADFGADQAGMAIGSFYLSWSQNGMALLGQMLIRALATSTCLYFVMLTIPFTALLGTLQRLGLPLILEELLLLMYRFIFILLSTASEIRIAQNSRNGYCSWKRTLHSLSLLVTQLLQRAMQHYHQFALSTTARGFNGTFRVWSSQQYQASLRYSLEAIIGCVGLVGLNFQF